MAQVQISVPALSLRDTRLDFNKFPRLFSEWLINESERRVCDPHLVLPYLLSTVSAFSGYSQVTLPTGWVINICTWAVAVGESGCNKSGAHDFVRDAAFEVFQAFVKDEVWVRVAGRERKRKRESNFWQLPPYSRLTVAKLRRMPKKPVKSFATNAPWKKGFRFWRQTLVVIAAGGVGFGDLQ